MRIMQERIIFMGKFIEWTSLEIEEMKTAFLQGQQIKVIARKLGRTPTALNKALSRFGIRPSRKSKITNNEMPIDWKHYLLPKGYKCEQPIILPSLEPVKPNLAVKQLDNDLIKNRERLKKTDSTWVPFSKIISYLEKQGHRITTVDADLGIYELDKRQVESGYLLLLANRLRVEEARPIFLVNEITW